MFLNIFLISEVHIKFQSKIGWHWYGSRKSLSFDEAMQIGIAHGCSDFHYLFIFQLICFCISRFQSKTGCYKTRLVLINMFPKRVYYGKLFFCTGQRDSYHGKFTVPFRALPSNADEVLTICVGHILASDMCELPSDVLFCTARNFIKILMFIE
jgi:hypothetical protein